MALADSLLFINSEIGTTGLPARPWEEEGRERGIVTVANFLCSQALRKHTTKTIWEMKVGAFERNDMQYIPDKGQSSGC